MFVDLIKEYLDAVESALELFERKFGRRDIVRAWGQGVIPKIGKLPGGIEYQMHGIGCWIDLPDGEVDFDFGPSGDVGFDTWRLWSYAEHAQNRYPDYKSQEDIDHALTKALAAGIVEPFENYPRLLRLTDTNLQ